MNVAALFALWFASAPVADMHEFRTQAQELFKQKKYHFCKDKKTCSLSAEEMKWCGLSSSEKSHWSDFEQLCPPDYDGQSAFTEDGEDGGNSEGGITIRGVSRVRGSSEDKSGSCGGEAAEGGVEGTQDCSGGQGAGNSGASQSRQMGSISGASESGSGKGQGQEQGGSVGEEGSQQQGQDTASGSSHGEGQGGNADSMANDGGEGSSRGEGEDAGAGGSKEEVPPPPEKPQEPEVLPPERLEAQASTASWIGPVLFWTILVLGLGFVIFVILRNFLSSRSGEKQTPDAPSRTRKQEEQTALLAQPASLSDIERLLLRAQQAAASGNYEAAVGDCYAALLRKLEQEGLVRLSRFNTSGDYVRSLAAHAQVQIPVQEIVRRVDQVQFGAHQPQELFTQIFSQVSAFVRTSIHLACLFFILTIAACQKIEPKDTRPAGQAALIDLATAYELNIEHQKWPITQLDRKDQTLILLRHSNPRSEQWDALLDWVADGGSLIVANGGGLPEELGISVIERNHLGGPLTFRQAWAERLGTDFKLFVPDYNTLLVAENSQASVVLSRNAGPYGVWISRGSGRIVVLADDHLFTNGALLAGDNAAFVVGVLSWLGSEKIGFVDAQGWHGPHNPFEAIANSRLLPILLQFMALMGIFFVHRGVTLGTPRNLIVKSRRAFTQHVQALGIQYAKSRASRYALRLYATWALERLRDRIMLGKGTGLFPLAKAVAQQTGLSEGEVMQILVEAHSARQEAAARGGSSEDLQLIHKLARIMQTTGGIRS